jgi:fumarylpyruvate hydrolase
MNAMGDPEASPVLESPPRPNLEVSGERGRFPVHRVYCVGQNYSEHAREMGASGRERPFFFSKPADAVHHFTDVPFPGMTEQLHHEVELVVALGKGGAEIPVSAALSHVYGYAVGVDLTRRDLQSAAKEKGRPWTTSKGFDFSGPVSAIHPVSRCGHLEQNSITLHVNGELRQRGDTSQMIWSVAEVIAELSKYFCLQAGDLIFTGTPSGVGELRPGDRVECQIEGLDRLSLQVVAKQ